MTDLTDKRPMRMIFFPDADSKTAIDAEKAKWTVQEKATVVEHDGMYVSAADPMGVMDSKRQKMLDLIDTNAKGPVDVLFVLKGDGSTIKSTGMIVRRLADPEDKKE